ncbi:MAG TPA: NAD(P)H-dependent oxidoreductase [Armatimonadota bacterium]|nr:NAD(P)H-dependent oxidoreductase [Armatimonadota bacterium]
MEIVAICGSPRPKGNTATLMEALLEGAREAGAKTTRFDPARMRIQDCNAGDECLVSPEAPCKLDDDMAEIYAALRRADAWVFGTPVYHAHVTGTLKRVIDRMYAFYTTESGEWQLGLEGRRCGAVIVVQADAEQETPRRVAEYLEQILRAYNVDVVGRIAESSLTGPTDAAGRPDLLARAKELGRELASEAKAVT